MRIGCVRALLLAVVTALVPTASLHAAPQSGPGPVEPPGGTPGTVTPPGSDGCPCNCPDPPVTPADIFFCGGGDLCAALEALEEGDLERWLEEHCFPADGDGSKCEECLPSKVERARRHCECEAHEVECDQDADDDVDCEDLKSFMAGIYQPCVSREEALDLVCCFLRHVTMPESEGGCEMEFAGGCTGLKACLESFASESSDEAKVFHPPLTGAEIEVMLSCYGCACCKSAGGTSGAMYLSCDDDGFPCDRDEDEDVDCDDLNGFLDDSKEHCNGGVLSDEKTMDLACAFIQGCAATAVDRCALAAMALACLESRLCRPLTTAEIEALEDCAGETCDLGDCCATATGSSTSAGYSKCGDKIRCDQDCNGVVDCADFKAFLEESSERCNEGEPYTREQILLLVCAFLGEGQCGSADFCAGLIDCVNGVFAELEEPEPGLITSEIAELAACVVCGDACGDTDSGARDGHGGSGCPGPEQSNPLTAQGVNARHGDAVVAATDIHVGVPGPDVLIGRRYSSNPNYESDCAMGEHWSLDQFMHVSHDAMADTLTLHACADRQIVVDVGSSEAVTDPSGPFDFWRVPGPTTEVVQRALASYGGTTYAVWRLREPGGASMDFFRTPESGESSAAAVPAGLLGRIAGVTDVHAANRHEYQYTSLVGSGGAAPRLRRIVANPTGTSAPPAAIVEFSYATEVDGNAGKLRMVTVFRHDALGMPVPVQRVKYGYFGDIGLVAPSTTISDNVGTPGDLVQVVQSERVDPLPGGTGLVWHDRVTHYRYHGNASTYGDEETIVGTAGQLKLVIEPEQMEFAASAWATPWATTPVTVEAFARHLLTKDDAAVAWEDGRGAVELASQVYARYETSGDKRVREAWAQSGCACSSSSTTHRRFAYYYEASTASRSTLRIDETPGPTSGSLRRHWYETYAPSGSGVHYLRSYAVEELDSETTTTHRAWIDWYDHDPASYMLVQERSPATFPAGIGTTGSYDYQPGTPSTAPVYDTTPTTGLSRRYTYAGSGELYAYKRLATVEAGEGASPGTWILTESRSYGDADGAGLTWDSTNSRAFLASRVQRFRTASGTGSSADDIEETRLFYGFSSGDAMAWEQVATEAELVSENGPGGWYSTWELFDDQGQAIWSVGADMSVTRHDYAAPTGFHATPTGLPQVVTRNAATTGLANPFHGLDTSGFGRSSDGGSLVFTYRRDLLGRVQQAIQPDGSSTYTVRNVYANPWRPMVLLYVETHVPHQWQDGTDLRTAGAATVSWYTAGGLALATSDYLVREVAYQVAAPGLGGWSMGITGYALGTEVGRRVTGYRYNGLVEWQGYWTGLDPNHAPFGGAHAELFEYDDLGRPSMQASANGTVTGFEYDVLDRVVRVSVDVLSGTTFPTTLTATGEYRYDGGTVSTAAIGDGYLTSTVALVGSGLDRTTTYTYDFRGRRTRTENPLAPHEFVAYDNLDRVVQRGVFRTVPTGIGTTLADRGVYSESAYSQRGLVYRERTATDPTSSSPAFLESHRWFDEAGRVVGSWDPSNPASKTTFDGLGRMAATYVVDRGGDPAPGASGGHAAVHASHAAVLTGDVVYEEREQDYSGSSGLPTLLTSRRRAHTAPDALTGAFASFASGDLDYVLTSYSASFYDPGRRPIRRVEYGTNRTADILQSSGGSNDAPTLGAAPNWDTAGNQLVTETHYDGKGRVWRIVDPTGVSTAFYYDLADRRIATVEAWDSANPPQVSWSTSTSTSWTVTEIDAAKPDVNRTTTVVYNGVGATTRLTAYNASDGVNVLQQHTDYHFGVAKGTGAADSALNSNDLLQYVDYPHTYNGLGGLKTFFAAYGYNLQGEAVYMEEGQGPGPAGASGFSSKHAYTRDGLGRTIVDQVTAFGSGIDAKVDALTYVYDGFGRLELAQSHDGYVSAGTPGTVTNAVAFTYTPLWQVAHVDQNPKRSLTYQSGNPSGFTKRAAYAYDTQASASGSGNYSRLQALTYPDGAVQGYAYGASTSTPDSRISRATQLDLGGSPLVKYGRIGLDLFAVVDYDVPNVQLDRARAETGASKDGEYPGLDRFGRVRRQLWVDGAFAGGTGSNPNKPPIVSTLYSYSKASDRLQAVDDRPGAGQPLSQAYTYDGLHRLVEAARGDWNGSAVAVSLGSQRWRNGSGDVTLDALGNWRESWTDLDGSGTYSDTTERDDRTHDIFNRIDARTLKGQGVSGADLTMGPLGYDLASNLSSWKVQAGTSATAVAAVHDAWNRLVDVTYAGDVRTRQEYNALHWRTFRVADTSGTGADPEQARLMYYGHDWRLLQEWVDDDLDFTDWSAGLWKLTDTDRTQQYVWGLRYIDDIVLHRADRNKDGDYVDAGDGTWHHLTDAQYSSVCLVDSAATVVERVTYSAYGIARHHWATDVDGDGAVTTGTGSDFSLVSTIASDTLANRTIGGSAYRSEADLDRSGVIDATDRGLVGSAKAALALGQLGAMGNAAPDNIVGWDGYLFNAESAVYTVRFRSYLPALGRWMERDPVGYRGSRNLYENVHSSPLVFVDPRGLQAQPPTTPAPPAVSPPATTPESPIDVGTYVCSDAEFGFFRELVKNIITNAHRAASGEEILGALTSDCKNDKCIRTWMHAQHGWDYDSSYGKDVGGGFGGGTCGSGTGFYRKDPNPQPEDGGRAKGGRSLEDLKAAITSKQVRFCKCCVIYIYACEVSCIGDFVAELSKVTGCTIYSGSGKVSTAHADRTPGTSRDPWRAEQGWDTWKDGKKTNTERGPQYITPRKGCP